MTPLLLLTSLAMAQGAPERQVPPSVLAEVHALENKFEIALVDDCNTERCFPKGCVYVDHAVTDRPRRTSLPGLGEGSPGPGSVEAQQFLTRARCSFAYEESVDSEDVANLSRRLESKLSKGWMIVGVDAQKLQPLPDYLQEKPAPDLEEEPVEEEPEIPLEPEVPEWSFALALRELWVSLLPHAWWMIGLGMLTVMGTVLIWAFRRVGQASIEDQMLLAEIARGGGETPDGEAPEGSAEPAEDDESFVAAQDAAWKTRLKEMDPGSPDPEVEGLIRELLLAGELPLLAKAVLKFPDTFPNAFPAGGEVAAAKLELSEYLKTVDAESLPSDAEFFRALNRHSLSAALATQSDAQIVKSLREEFGAAGLVTLIGSLPARAGALLFALAPASEQHEMVRIFSAEKMAQLAEQLLRSNRMDPAETTYLFDVVEAERADKPRPDAPRMTEVTDRGTAYDAVGALAVLLPQLDVGTRNALFGSVLQRFGGRLPAWYRGIFLPDMLDRLSAEARVDLFLEVEVERLSAWVSLLDAQSQSRILGQMPDSLRASVQATSQFPSRSNQLQLAAQGRRDLARGFQAQLGRAGLGFEQVLQTPQASA